MSGDLTHEEPTFSDVRSCSSCEARIVWAITTSGKRMPVDLVATENGNVLLCGPRKEGSLRAMVLGRGDRLLVESPLRTSHHFTCPDGQAWRR